MKKLSDSEKIVIREIFRRPSITLNELAEVLENAENRQVRKPNKAVDLRSVSKFKSIGYKKIREGLLKLATDFRLDLSLQEDTAEGKKEEEQVNEILLRNGILKGFDFRVNAMVYLLFILKEQSILPWQAHHCRPQCETECKNILDSFRGEHGLPSPNIQLEVLDLIEITIKEIIAREK
ncbi:hypothetical protein CEE45_16530 [Candidatus Heimdallarchaeota archaeon B3_Heim]|nr:MAG: hypothetical protein CEE45_16530 [Candidatus Heimdallarchaeota archaeon B3_Heim]